MCNIDAKSKHVGLNFSPQGSPAACGASVSRCEDGRTTTVDRFWLCVSGGFRIVGGTMADVVTFGEIMLRLNTPGRQRFSQASSFEIAFGGAEANVAVAIAQLGGSADFVTRVPQNEIAQRAMDELRRLGVGVAKVVRGGARIGVNFLEIGASQRPGKVIYDRSHTSMAEAQPHEFDWDAILAGARWFHWSGITAALSESAAATAAAAAAAARRLGLTVSFDMNYRAKLWTTEQAGAVLTPLMKHVNICSCGAEEARSVFGINAEREEAIAAALVKRFGFDAVTMTQRRAATADHSSWSAMFHTGGKTYTSQRHEITIIDRVGAGDSFVGALIFSMLRGDSPQRAIDFAAAASALKHTIPGDYSLVSLAEVEALAGGGHGGRVQR